MTDQPTPQTADLVGDILVACAERQPMLDLIIRYGDSRAAQARTEALDVDVLAEALHDAMCDVSHHDRPPARCSRWLTYPSIARSVVPRYAAILAAKADR